MTSKRNNVGRSAIRRGLGLVLVLTVLLAALPMGLSASAANTVGEFFVAGNPPFAYVITGIEPENPESSVKLYQNSHMQSYSGYNGSYTIPEKVWSTEDMRYYTVNEIGGAVGETVPGALQNVPVQGIVLPATIKKIGSKAFAGSSLREITFPSSVTSLAGDAFEGVSVRKLTLLVSDETTISGRSSYTNSKGAVVPLPAEINDLQIKDHLSVSGHVAIAGDADIESSAVTVKTGASLSLGGKLTGNAQSLIEVKNGGALTLHSDIKDYKGIIRLTGSSASFVNLTGSPVTVTNVFGQAVTVQTGGTCTGAESPSAEKPDDETAPKPESTDPTIYANYGGKVAIQENGKSIVITTFNGYRVEDVVINGHSMGSITRYEFKQASKDNVVTITFAAGKVEQGPVAPTAPVSFIDVPANAPYSDAVYFLSSYGIIQGVGGSAFSPRQTTTRAMYLSLLSRLGRYNSQFAINCKTPVYPRNVTESAWYGASVSWAAGLKFIETEDGAYDASQNITREEAAMILYRYTHARGYATRVEAGQYRRYSDSVLFTGTAREALVWAASNGYIPTSRGMIDPAATMTRAETAQMFARYLVAYR